MLETWKQEFEGKNICIWGYGIEGKATYRLIRSLFPDMEITIADGGKGLATAKETTEHTICLSDKDCDFSKFDLVMKAPGIVVPEGQSLDNISGEAQLFLKHYASKTIGVTGTKGKSTTTSLAHVAIAIAIPKSALGSSTSIPPVTFTYTSCLERFSPTLFSNTARIWSNLLVSIPFATLLGEGYGEEPTSA